jgi:hypothetical protein
MERKTTEGKASGRERKEGRSREEASARERKGSKKGSTAERLAKMVPYTSFTPDQVEIGKNSTHFSLCMRKSSPEIRGQSNSPNNSDKMKLKIKNVANSEVLNIFIQKLLTLDVQNKKSK